MRRALAAALVVVTAFVAVTAIALEGREVVVVETTDGLGNPRRTRTWIADESGSAWIEAANPERPFLADLQRRPDLMVERHGVRQACRAEVARNPDGHRHVRRLLRDRYGWADCWIALLADTHASLGIRLVCA